jgi:hypothetical protein
MKSRQKAITVRCFAELNDFLPPVRRQVPFTISVKEPVTVGEAILGLGIPLSEVDLVTVRGQPARRGYRLRDGDRISVYPAFETFDISTLQTIQKQPIRITRFILDAHLGKLARYLRMLGFDSLYRNDYGDDEIVEIASGEIRIILTRDKLLLRSPRVLHGYYVRATEKHSQLVEVVEKFDLYSQFQSFTRCMTCNSELMSIRKEGFRNRIPEEVFRNFDEFSWCRRCDKIFWKGSHFERMEGMILDMIYSRTRNRSNGLSDLK